MAKFCMNCGKKLNKNEDACLNCGIIINEKSEKNIW